MKKTLNKKKIALASNSLLLAATLAGGVLAIPVSAASYDHTYNLDVSKQFQEFDGWGLSLSWWATEIGDWTRVGSSGLTKREEIMEAIYGKSGLNLNIARYNVGGGDDPTHTHMTGDRNTPGWKGATKLAEDQELPEGTKTYTGAAGAGQGVTYIPNDKYFYEAEDGSTLPWQETPDWKQLWVLDWLQNYRQSEGDLLTEYYSNSPPYWLTRSGCSSGAPDGDKSGNLINDEAHNKEFVKYLLDVYEYLVGQGFQLDNIHPITQSTN
ncbi:MAG: hypothetical protein K2L87_04440 [Clostridiales bacterium]|nr:hypothetical protein [Clostridiales bacterium]